MGGVNLRWADDIYLLNKKAFRNSSSELSNISTVIIYSKLPADEISKNPTVSFGECLGKVTRLELVEVTVSL